MQGAVSSSMVQQLCELLKGLSGRPAAPFKHQEVVLKATRSGASPVELKLQRSLLDDPNDPQATLRWKARLESLPMRGKANEQLQATVRGLSEACCYGANTIDFWKALGFKAEYQSVQEGALFVVWQDEHQLFVRITCLKKVPKSGILEQAIPITPEFWLVEVFLVVSTDVPAQMETLYGEACKSVANFASRVKDFVVLKKTDAR